MKEFKLYFLFILIVFVSCQKKENINTTVLSAADLLKMGWDVPTEDMFLSSFPPDRIQSIDHPYFELLSRNNMRPSEIVYIYRYGNTIKIYPENIIVNHELVNDQIDDHYFCVSFCPLTGSAVAWDREMNGAITEFGVSGHLYLDNLIAYDRNSINYWSQMQSQSIKGNSRGDILQHQNLIKTTGATAMASFPNSFVLLDSLLPSCDSICQGKHSYHTESGSYKNTNGNEYFGIIKKNVAHSNKALLFAMDDFTDSIQIYRLNYFGLNLVVVGSAGQEFITSFIHKGPNTIEYFSVQNSLPIIMSDNQGNSYDITGQVVSGVDMGQQLSSPYSYTAHYIAWHSFFENGLIFFNE